MLVTPVVLVVRLVWVPWDFGAAAGPVAGVSRAEVRVAMWRGALEIQTVGGSRHAAGYEAGLACVVRAGLGVCVESCALASGILAIWLFAFVCRGKGLASGSAGPTIPVESDSGCKKTRSVLTIRSAKVVPICLFSRLVAG